VTVAGPARYVYAVQGLVEEGAEVGEGWEGEGVGGLEGEVDVGEGFEAEVEGLESIWLAKCTQIWHH